MEISQEENASFIQGAFRSNGALITERNHIQFTIHGKVIGKGRPHFVRKTGAAITPQATRSYESLIRDYAMREMGGRDPWTFPVAAIMVAYYEIPKSWTKLKKDSATRQLVAPAKPDVDNVVKVVLDACNRTVYVDDTQVVQCFVMKKFGDAPRLEVTFAEAADRVVLTMDGGLDVQLS